jgi:hypothetical protein
MASNMKNIVQILRGLESDRIGLVIGGARAEVALFHPRGTERPSPGERSEETGTSRTMF